MYSDGIVLIGSCFSDHIGARLQEAKFDTCYNPTGIVFDPLSVAHHLDDFANHKQYEPSELFQPDELWVSWFHHSDFSSITPEETCRNINEAIQLGAAKLKSASYLFITLGTAYSYLLKSKQLAVANNHKAPGDWFEKRLLSIDEIVQTLQKSIHHVKTVNANIEVVFTVSPVKHVRDGIIENSRSKARLLESAHQLATLESNCSYFPAYELVNDILRDHRFYAPDLAHPNQQSIQFVFDFFCKTYFSNTTQQQMQQVMQIVQAKYHRPLHPETKAHREFLKIFRAKTETIKAKLPGLDWSEEEKYFGSYEI